MSKMLIGLIICILCVSCGVIKGHKNSIIDYTVKVMDEIYIEDNIAEKWIEDAIENSTGFEMDLSPYSQEEEY